MPPSAWFLAFPGKQGETLEATTPSHSPGFAAQGLNLPHLCLKHALGTQVFQGVAKHPVVGVQAAQ